MDKPTDEQSIGRAPGGQRDAREEIARTVVSPWGKRILGGGMLSVLALVAATDGPKLAGDWGRLVAALMPGRAQVALGAGPAGRVLAWNDGVLASIKTLETRLDQESPMCRLVQPRVQELLARMGEGGDEVMIGREGWLFYRPSFHYLTAPVEGFASKGGSGARERGFAASVAAISDFAASLKQRGVALVLLPVPPKLAVHPEKFIAGGGSQPLEPAGYATWVRQLREAGVRVFDPMPVFAGLKAEAAVAGYLRTDTHWRPEAMEKCAQGLADFLEAEGLVKGGRQAAATVLVPATASNRGDLWRMLRINGLDGLYPPEEVPIHQVRTTGGLRWQASRDGEVLLLGDSFCNMFSLGEMGWGEGAGFAEHLGHRLARPVDAILRNSDGAHATRRLLARELVRGDDRLKGKSVVVWEFAARELTEGIWPKMACVLGERRESRFVKVEPGKSLEVEGTIVTVSPLPYPGSVPYQDHVATVVLRDVTGADGCGPGGTDAVVYARSMEANRWTDFAKLRAGQRVRLRLACWEDFESRYGAWNRSEPDAELLAEPVNWLAEILLDRDGA